MRLTSRLPRVPALLGATALLVASLAGCSAIPGSGGCDRMYDSGNASDIVTATGEPGSALDVSFPTPLVSQDAEVSVIGQGNGASTGKASQVDYVFSVWSGSDGSILSDPAATGRLQAGLDGSAVSQALMCAQVGDRLALTTTIADGFGAGAGGNAGLADTDTVVVVLDITAAYLGKADGLNQLPQDDMPTVVTAVDGTPAIAIGFAPEPTTTRIETVKGGDGPTVASDGKVVVNLRAWTWPAAEGDEPVEYSDANTWSGHRAFTADLSDPASNPLPPGVQDALAGAKVGSQLLVVIPPGDDAYPTPPEGLSADATMIWVVDLLGIQK